MKRRSRTPKTVEAVLAGSLLAISIAGCAPDEDDSAPLQGPPLTDPRCADFSPLRNLYWGDLHVHTSYSFDAWLHDVRSDPDGAYRFAKGQSVRLPPLGPDGQGTQPLQLARPLDFAAVTDHAEFLAEVDACTTPGSRVYDDPLCESYRANDPAALPMFGLELGRPSPQRFDAICGSGGVDCRGLAADVWTRTREAAEDHYDRTDACTFTTFVGYEWSGIDRLSNLHRNVIFRSERVPDLPASYFEAPDPATLRRRLDTECRKGLSGCDVLLIPHNTNWSNGKMFIVEPDPSVDEAAAAELRADMEPLLEIFQHKGDAECQNGLSGYLGGPDELCGFEKLRAPGFEDCGDRTGNNGMVGLGCLSRVDFLRGILIEGLREEARLGQNPYRLGVIASTDTHNGTPGYVEEAAYLGHVGSEEATAVARLTPDVPAGPRNNPGGLVAVWAEQNSRDAIFEALRRRETYGTSGPRIAVRMFAGWELPPDLCARPDFVEVGYRRGVPMGGELAQAQSPAPMFAVSALADPGVAEQPGTPLERIQVVKGSLDAAGEARVEVFDIAGGANGASVDLQTCEPQGQGAQRLCSVWTDPAFDPDARAFYYVRVLENPVCRWSTRDCLSDPRPRPEACDDPTLEQTIQERAWTSPVWYRP